MKAELKKFTSNQRLSEETLCFAADLYVDGVKVASVANRGQGGSCEVHHYPGQRDALAAFEAHVRTLPPVVEPDFTLPMDFDLWLAMEAGRTSDRARLKRLCSKQVLFRIPGTTYGEGAYQSVNLRYSPEVRARLLARYPGAVILNEELASA